MLWSHCKNLPLVTTTTGMHKYIAKNLKMIVVQQAANLSYLLARKQCIYFNMSSMCSFSIKFTWNNCSVRTMTMSLPCLLFSKHSSVLKSRLRHLVIYVLKQQAGYRKKKAKLSSNRYSRRFRTLKNSNTGLIWVEVTNFRRLYYKQFNIAFWKM
jgi:hypothetical protein